MNVLITGGAGFIGSNLANTLAAQGHSVTAVDNLFLGRKENLNDRVRFYEMSVMNRDAMTKIFQEKNFDYVFHLAAFSSNPMFRPSPLEGLNVNIIGFSNIIELCKKFGVKKLIYASTSSIYSGSEPPFLEDMPVKPKIHYEVSFYARELIARAYKQDFGFDSAGLRFFSVYGFNERHKGEFANLISQFIWSMKQNKQPVIYGDGEQTRDFIFISDVVDAIILATESKMSGVFNVGTGRSHSLNTVVDLINKSLCSDIKAEYMDNPLKNYVYNTQADTTKIKKFGYSPKTTLENGIKKLVKHY